ncbi:TetR/AcrR family transcriptional regulator [Arthrobacter agilis]|uniref:TetR/AcrR family transcriptional regulator n=1 Tax=Arthrobacter agilis TaxID=37921 RepID=UPI002365E883|nr:TetR/AcrR family transcriptional regulator [Arthrobacter agilis]WDF34646.1 TetR/AcrR family transcriptional regulator [Arthrobacter agilis]
MTLTGPGRPRVRQSTRPGATAREEILDAAAELFTTQGYATTSTRAIAEAVGMRQSSLYHHFATKDDILEVLLAGTLTEGLAFARAVSAGGSAADDVSPASRLYAVALFDGSHLCSGRWNIGILYHLPEARDPRFTQFLADRDELRRLYRSLGAAAVSAGLWPGDTRQHGELAFRLVESLVSLRVDGQITPSSAQDVADAALALCGFGGELPTVRDDGLALITALGRVLPAGPSSPGGPLVVG